MKLFSPRKPIADQINALELDPVEAAVAAPALHVHVDVAYHLESQLIVVGWASPGLTVALAQEQRTLEARCIRLARPDVAAHVGLASGADLGFVLIIEAQGARPAPALQWRNAEGRLLGSLKVHPQERTELSADELDALGAAVTPLATLLAPHGAAWRQLIGRGAVAQVACASAGGFLEAAAACRHSGVAVVAGWAVQAPGTTVWLEDDQGTVHALSGAYRRFRQDVQDAYGHDFIHGCRDAGFCLRLDGLAPGRVLSLKALTTAGVHVLGEVHCGTLPADPVAAARWLFGLSVPIAEMHRRVPLFDSAVLEPLLRRREQGWQGLPVRLRELGAAVVAPIVSVIVPLYGRIDLVEHQLLEFCKDAWFAEHAELIYVIDDPRLVDGFVTQAETLHRLYRMPFKWVWGNANRGFSGANNLGAAHARGRYLLFLNSDAFPQKPGWLQALVDVLETRPEIGAVGPRLVFGDGSIQHSGLEFMRREELGIWINHHPRMGLDAALDPHTELTTMRAITGACLAMRRVDFDRVGGWDTSYLIGDFEDSDLCLKLQAAGLDVAYLPTVQLTHLERQSFKLLGPDEFRTRVVIYNAVRHQTRWGAFIEQGEQPQAA